MPASSPPVDDAARTNLTALGRKIRERRMELRLSMNATAEVAGISRVTLHRIERGGPSVTMGAYLNVITALGLGLNIAQAGHACTTDPAASVRLGDYPQLRRVAWQLDQDTEITEADALQLYERNWRHVDTAAMRPRERQFVQHLADTWGHGRLLV